MDNYCIDVDEEFQVNTFGKRKLSTLYNSEFINKRIIPKVYTECCNSLTKGSDYLFWVQDGGATCFRQKQFVIFSSSLKSLAGDALSL